MMDDGSGSILCIYNQLNIVALLIYIHVGDNWLLEQDDTQ